MRQNEKGFSVVEVIMAIVIVGLMGAVVWMWMTRQNTSDTTKNTAQTTDTQSKSQEDQTKKPDVVTTPAPVTLTAGTFGKAGNYGTAQMRGYATVSHKNLGYPGCDTDPSCKYDQVQFHVIETPSTHLLAYMKSLVASGNLMATKDSFLMGCLKNDQINYASYSDAKGTQNITLSKSNTTALTSATKDHPVALEAEKLKATGGIDGLCLSLFTTYSLLQ